MPKEKNELEKLQSDIAAARKLLQSVLGTLSHDAIMIENWIKQIRESEEE